MKLPTRSQVAAPHPLHLFMKRLFFSFTTILALAFTPAYSATPEQEKAFMDTYKKAFESGDKPALAGLLYTEGTPRDIVALFTRMQDSAAGAKIAAMELTEFTPAELEKLQKPMPGRNGRSFVISLPPYKQLVVTIEPDVARPAGKNTLKTPVAEKDGRLVIPLLVPAKK